MSNQKMIKHFVAYILCDEMRYTQDEAAAAMSDMFRSASQPSVSNWRRRGEALLETLNSLKDKIQGMRNAQQRAKRAVDAFVNQEEDTVVEKLPKRCDQYAAYLLRTDHDYSKAGIARALGLRSPQEAKELLEKAKRSFEECAAYSAERKEITKNYEKARKKVGDALGL